MAPVAPMPSASDAMAKAAKSGPRRSSLTAYRTSWSQLSTNAPALTSRTLLFQRLDPPELQRRRAPRLGRLMPARTVLFFERVERAAQLVVEVAFDAAAMHQIPPQAAKTGETSHAYLLCSA